MSRVTVMMMTFSPTDSQRKCFDDIRDNLRSWHIAYEKYLDETGIYRTGTYASTVQIDILTDKIIDFVIECQEAGYDKISGTDFMDGLRTAHPDLYRFSVGYFGGHDFVWRLK